MSNTCDMDDCKMSLQAGWDMNNPRNITTVCSPSYLNRSVTSNPMIINTEVGSVSIILNNPASRHAIPELMQTLDIMKIKGRFLKS